jgi:UPF0042 nucleotide-binding protein
MTSDSGSNPITPELVIISGMSGAGRSTAAKCLEDLGWFVVDNLPPALIRTMVELGARSQGSVPKIAVVVDVRGRSFFDHLLEALAELDKRDIHRRTVFLEASGGRTRCRTGGGSSTASPGSGTCCATCVGTPTW